MTEYNDTLSVTKAKVHNRSIIVEIEDYFKMRVVLKIDFLKHDCILYHTSKF